jgi:hypothetical protein
MDQNNNFYLKNQEDNFDEKYLWTISVKLFI